MAKILQIYLLLLGVRVSVNEPQHDGLDFIFMYASAITCLTYLIDTKTLPSSCHYVHRSPEHINNGPNIVYLFLRKCPGMDGMTYMNASLWSSLHRYMNHSMIYNMDEPQQGVLQRENQRGVASAAHHNVTTSIVITSLPKPKSLRSICISISPEWWGSLCHRNSGMVNTTTPQGPTTQAFGLQTNFSLLT